MSDDGSNFTTCLLFTGLVIVSVGGAAFVYHGVGEFQLKGKPASQSDRMLLVGGLSFMALFFGLPICGLLVARICPEGPTNEAPSEEIERGEQDATHQTFLIPNAGQDSGRPTSQVAAERTIVTQYHFIPTTVELHSDVDSDLPPSYEAALAKGKYNR